MKANFPRTILLTACILFLISAACVMPSFSFPSSSSGNSNVPAYESTDTQENVMVLGENITADYTETVTPTQTPWPTMTGVAQPTLRPSRTPLPTPTAFKIRMPYVPVCDAAKYIEDVTIPDGTRIAAGTVFVKTWKLKNTGTCTWTDSYSAVSLSGDSMNGSPLSIGKSVKPGETVDVSVTMTAPSKPGKYRGYWAMAGKKGKTFYKFYVEIEVYIQITPTSTIAPTITSAPVNPTSIPPTQTATPTATRVPVISSPYNFAENYCKLEWKVNFNTSLPCPMANEEPGGFVKLVENPLMEGSVQETGKSLLVSPPVGASNSVSGTSLAMLIKPGDHFRAKAGCENGAIYCNVNFELVVYIEGESGAVSKGQWAQSHDSILTDIDVDLSDMAGKNVKFVLVVTSNSVDPNQRAIWVNPRVGP